MVSVSRRKSHGRDELRVVTFKAPLDMYRALRMRAVQDDRDASEVIREALQKYLTHAVQ
jgi:hypothetical protein